MAESKWRYGEKSRGLPLWRDERRATSVAMERTGKCMCGAVRFTAKDLGEASACHCGMCRRWAGGPWIGVSAGPIEWQDDEALEVVESSAWAERGFCRKCGSGLFYRITAEGKHQGVTSVSLGALDDPKGIALTKEWFIDRKPDVYALAGDRERVTEAEIMAAFGGG